MASKHSDTSLKPCAGRKVGFALGGLGGSNAQGVGFLVAALKAGCEPDIISCTSGMIFWAARWMDTQDADVLEGEFQHEVERAKSYPVPYSNMAVAPSMLMGMPGVFHWAWTENLADLFAAPWPNTVEGWQARLRPARQLVPERSDEDFERIARIFNRWSKPAMFNSYSPRDGIEYLHMNDAALQMYRRIQTRRKALSKPGPNPNLWQRRSLPRVVPAKIDREAVRDALWLTGYGFGTPQRPQNRIDGAYVRQFILSELSEADVIFAPRPQSATWRGPLPASEFEVRDFETEMWFNGSYREQVARIDFVNRLIANGLLTGKNFHEITLVPIEIEVQRGFFSYFLEDISVFRDAKEQSRRAFQKYCGGSADVELADLYGRIDDLASSESADID